MTGNSLTPALVLLLLPGCSSPSFPSVLLAVAININSFYMPACPYTMWKYDHSLGSLPEAALGCCVFKHNKLAELTRLLLIHLNTQHCGAPRKHTVGNEGSWCLSVLQLKPPLQQPHFVQSWVISSLPAALYPSEG